MHLAVFAYPFTLSLNDNENLLNLQYPYTLLELIILTHKRMIRKGLLLLTLLLLLVSCNNQQNKKTVESDSVMQIDKSIEFLSLFKTIDPIGLHIYPPSWNRNGDLIKFPFEGKAIDVFKFPYVDNEEIFINIQACKEGNSNIYAIGKFDLNINYYGLIIRQYSQYDESLIQLLLWDKKQKEIIKGLDLANSFGDEGWIFDVESWIKTYKYNSVLEIVSRRKDFIPKADFKSNEDMDSITTDTLWISRLSNSKFITRLENKKDTIKYKLKNWK